MLSSSPLARLSAALRPLPAPPRYHKSPVLPSRPLRTSSARFPEESVRCGVFTGAVTETRLYPGELISDDCSAGWFSKVVSVVRLVLAGAFVFLLPVLGLVRPVSAAEGRGWEEPGRSMVKVSEERGLATKKTGGVAVITRNNTRSVSNQLQYKIQEV